MSSQGTSRVFLLSVLSVIVITVAIVGIVIFARNRVREAKNYSKSERLQEKKAAPVSEVVTGSLGLSPKGTATTYKAGDTVSLFVYADSKGQEITGYDAVLRYDSKRVRFESVKSVLEGMDIYETEDELDTGMSELIVTGIQSLSVTQPFVFTNTALAEVTFTVLQSGPTTIQLVYEPGSQRESNLITTHNEDIVSSVMGMTLNEAK